MADRKKFEEMLERLINEDKEGAEELFHEIVVERSREIYESLLESDLEDEEVDEATDEEVDESDEEVDESDEEVDEATDEEVEEGFDLDEFEVEADPMDMGGDPADDMMGDIEMGSDEEGDDEEEGEEELEDRVVDLEDALDELKAEFEKMMAGEEGEESDDMGDDEGEEDEGDEEEADKESLYFGEAEDDDDEEVEESSDEEVEEKATVKKSEAEQMREYVEKVAAKMGDNGANTKSTVAGKNDMGGTASNITSGGESKGEGTKGGLAAPTPKEENMGNVNVPGGKASKSMKAQPKGHGAEKKGTGDNGANTKSVVGK